MSPRTSFLTLIALLAAAVAPVRAEPVTDHLPPGALAFVVVHDLHDASEKLHQVASLFEEAAGAAIPAPLPAIKAATGLGPGLDDRGDAMLALLAGPGAELSIRPMLLLPVNDYAAFANSLNGDPTGDVSPVTIAAEEVFAARLSSFALLMNLEHRDQMESLLAQKTAQPQPQDQTQAGADPNLPFNGWLSEQNLAIVVTPAGLKALATPTAAGQPAPANQFSDADRSMTGLLRELRQIAVTADSVFKLAGVDVAAVAGGIAIDDGANLRLTQRIRLANMSQPSPHSAIQRSAAAPLARFADQPFVAVAGGPAPLPADAAARLVRRLIEQNATLYGFQEFAQEDWSLVEQSWQKSLAGIESASAIFLPGAKADPHYSNLFAILEVGDSAAYMKSLSESFEIYNALVAKSQSDIKLIYDVAEEKLADRPALKFTVDLAAAVADPNVPGARMAMREFGEDGKLRIRVVAVDNRTVVAGVGAEQQLTAVADHAASGKPGLGDSPDVETALKLLDPAAPWQGAVSPQGWMVWFERVLEDYLGQFAGGAPSFPDYPPSPPIGISLNFADGTLTGQLAWPRETLAALAQYLKASQ